MDWSTSQKIGKRLDRAKAATRIIFGLLLIAFAILEATDANEIFTPRICALMVLTGFVVIAIGVLDWRDKRGDFGWGSTLVAFLVTASCYLGTRLTNGDSDHQMHILFWTATIVAAIATLVLAYLTAFKGLGKPKPLKWDEKSFYFENRYPIAWRDIRGFAPSVYRGAESDGIDVLLECDPRQFLRQVRNPINHFRYSTHLHEGYPLSYYCPMFQGTKAEQLALLRELLKKYKS